MKKYQQGWKDNLSHGQYLKYLIGLCIVMALLLNGLQPII